MLLNIVYGLLALSLLASLWFRYLEKHEPTFEVITYAVYGLATTILSAIILLGVAVYYFRNKQLLLTFISLFLATILILVIARSLNLL